MDSDQVPPTVRVPDHQSEPDTDRTVTRSGDTPLPSDQMEGYDQSLDVTLDNRTRYSYLDFRAGRTAADKNAAEIGRGGFGRVLIAFDHAIGRQIAVKELIKEPSTDTLSRFLTEARITGQLDHPSIVPVYEIARREDGSTYYTMKLVRGRTLSAALAECRSLADRLKLLSHFVDVCNAIAYAHNRHVIHRDIKTKNIMIGEFGETVLLDWGLAKVITREEAVGETETSSVITAPDTLSTSETLDGQVVGSPHYMSPEQARGQISELDERSDIWSLGAVLYEILTGFRPFHGMKLAAIIQATRQGTVKPVREICPETPSELAAVAEKALSFQKEDRYQHAKELADEIEAFRSGLRVTAYDYTSWELLRRFILKNKLISAIISIFLLFLLIGSGMILKAYQQAETARQQEQQERIHAQDNARNANFNLSKARQEEALREIADLNYLEALALSAEALLSNPYNPASPKSDASGETLTEAQNINLLEQQSTLYRSYINLLLVNRRLLTGHTDTVNRAAFSPDGSLFASVANDRTIRLGTAAKPENWEILGRHDDYLYGLAFSPDGRLLATGGKDDQVKFWDVHTKQPFGVPLSVGGDIYALAFSPDGRHLAIGCGDGRLLFSPALDFTRTVEIGRQSDLISSLVFSPDNRLLAVGDHGGEIVLLQADDGKVLARFSSGIPKIRSLDISPDNLTLAGAGDDETVRLWDLTSCHQSGCPVTAELKGHQDFIFSVKFSPGGRLLASSSRDFSVKFWDLASRRSINTIKRPITIAGIAFSPKNSFLTAEYDGTVGFWDFLPKDKSFSLVGMNNVIVTAAFSQQGGNLATTTWQKVYLWDIKARQLIATLPEPGNLTWAAAFSPDQRWLATGGTDRLIRLYALPDRRLTLTLAGHENTVFDLVFNPRGDRLASVGADRTLRVWDVETGRPITVLNDNDAEVMAVAFSPDGRWLATGDKGKNIVIRDTATGQRRQLLTGHQHWVTDLAYSPDGTLLLSTGKDGAIMLWDAASGALRQTLAGHTQWVNDAGFSPDGKMLISGSDDRTIRIWDIASGRTILLLDFPNEITIANFTPDGGQFIFNDGFDINFYPVDFTILRQDLPQLLADAALWAGRPLGASPDRAE